MYFLKYETVPNPESSHLREFGATLALCWINALTEMEADARARDSIVRGGWDIVSLEEAYPVSLDDIDPGRPAYKFFLCAQEKGEPVIFVAGPPKTSGRDAA